MTNRQSDLSRINLTDTKDQIVNKIKKAKTDLYQCHLLPRINKRPEALNLLGIFSILNNSIRGN